MGLGVGRQAWLYQVVAQRQLLRQLKHCVQADGSEVWLLQLEGASNLLPVSRRQLAAVRQAMQNL